MAHGAVDRIESGDLILVEQQFGLLRDVAQHTSSSSRSVACSRELSLELGARDIEHSAQLGRVEARLWQLAVDDHQVVALAALRQELAIAVINLASGWVQHNVAQHIVARHIFVFRIEELNPGQAHQYRSKDEQYHKLQASQPRKALSTTTHRTDRLGVKSAIINLTKRIEARVLTTKRKI